ncbi:hypothetical protein RB195_003576 [Necator americanus]|uniref:Uncharacterized protein n=1 Tax=Necator americanus TaxID=51031 RepID=A0ABR1DPR3_NECAM
MLEFFAALAGSWEDPAMDSIDGESKTSKRGLRPETLKLIRQRGAAGNEELSSELARTAMRADHIHTVSKLKVSQEYKLLLCLTFVKLKKAFGLAETSILATGVLQFYYNIIIDVERGPGDTISPSVFTLTLENAVKPPGKLEWDDIGVKVDGRQLHPLRFADDIVPTRTVNWNEC